MVGISDCNICLTQPCKNSGLCLASASRFGFTCECEPGFAGLDCSQRISRCFPGACGKDGQCIDTESRNFKCRCPIGKYGTRCEIGQTITIPSFNNNSFMAYPGVKSSWEQFSAYVKFRPASSDGILLFNGGVDVGETSQDFILIQLRNGYAQFQFDSGTGPAVIQSAKKINLNTWNTVEVERFRKHGSITLNANIAQKGVSPGSSIALNLGSKLYIGGIGSDVSAKKLPGNQAGFNGCIEEVVVNEKTIALVKGFTQYQDVTNCHRRLSPCQPLTCQNNATCKVLSAVTYSCKCLPRYQGKHCEQFTSRCGAVDDCLNGGACVADIRNRLSCQCRLGFTGPACEQAIQIRNEALFKGDGYLQYPRSILRKIELSLLKFDIKSRARDGLVFWFGEAEDTSIDESPDFLAIGLKNGFLEVSYELGSGLAVVLTTKQINDGEWHTVKISRNARNATLSIDGKDLGRTQSSGINTKLDIEASMYFGGGKDVPLMTRQKYQESFIGCLGNIYIEDLKISLQQMAEEGRSVHPCTEKST
eukprot:gene15277-16853_t